MRWIEAIHYLSCNCISKSNLMMTSPLCSQFSLLICLHYLNEEVPVLPHYWHISSGHSDGQGKLWVRGTQVSGQRRPHWETVTVREMVASVHLSVCTVYLLFLLPINTGNNILGTYWANYKRLKASISVLWLSQVLPDDPKFWNGYNLCIHSLQFKTFYSAA